MNNTMNTFPQRKLQGRKEQKGAALIVALILLLVITILAVSMMGTSRLQLVMAGNNQFSLLAFQAAQSAIESRLILAGFTTGAPPANVTYPYNGIGSSATAAVTYQAATEVPAGGYSIGAGFQAYHFEIDVTATAPRGAASNQTQGVYIVGPGGS